MFRPLTSKRGRASPACIFANERDAGARWRAGIGRPEGPQNGDFKHGRYTREMIASQRWLRRQIQEVRVWQVKFGWLLDRMSTGFVMPCARAFHFSFPTLDRRLLGSWALRSCRRGLAVPQSKEGVPPPEDPCPQGKP